MEIDLTALTGVITTLNSITDNLSVSVPSLCASPDAQVTAVLDRLQAAATAARLARTADLTDLSLGVTQIRTTWLQTEDLPAGVRE